MAEYSTLKAALAAFATRVKNLLKNKQDLLEAGSGIMINKNVISAVGGGGGEGSAGLIELTGEQLINIKTQGLYLCTQTQSPFSAGEIYKYYEATQSWSKVSTTVVTLPDTSPQISSFYLYLKNGSSVSNTTTIEVGETLDLGSYKFKITQPNKWDKFEIEKGTDTLVTIDATGQEEYTGSLTKNNSVVIKNPGTSVTCKLVGHRNDTTTKPTQLKTITATTYAYFGTRGDDDYSADLPSIFKWSDISGMTKSSLSDNSPKDIDVPIDPKNDKGFAYLWILIPAYRGKTISQIYAGDFVFPYVSMGTVDVTNQHGITTSYKCYRSGNRIGKDTVELTIKY